MPERMSFQTSDAVEIVGDFVATAGEAKAYVLFLHMMPADRKSWSAFAAQIAVQDGFASLAIDLRGHGESVRQGSITLDYKQFDDAAHQASIKDVEAAIAWLTAYGAPANKIILIGASIGANLALWYAAEHQKIPGAALLSPGLDYRGIKTDIFVSQLAPAQKLFLTAARDDAYSFETIQALAAAAPCSVTKVEYNAGGHGTTIFTTTDLASKLAAWLALTL